MAYITLDEFIQDIQAIIDTNPDFVYPDHEHPDAEMWLGVNPWDTIGEDTPCRYTLKHSPEQPACIVGHYLNRHGWLDYAEEGNSAKAVLRNVERHETVIFASDVLDLADLVQSRQDSRDRWRDCLERSMYVL